MASTRKAKATTTSEKKDGRRKKAAMAGGGQSVTNAKPVRGRPVPRAFEFHWGGGNIVAEACFRGKYTEPAVQLLEYEGHAGHEGAAAPYGVRFCYYSLDGRIPRSTMMIDGDEAFTGPRAALKRTRTLSAV